MLPVLRGILPRIQRTLEGIRNQTLRVAEIPSGRMPDSASRMLALPTSFVLHERDHYSKRSNHRSRKQAG
jgi:hypothetical protein